jgi:hypothetical protein
MTNPKYNASDLTEVASNMYHAFTGDEPDAAMRSRIQVGVEAAVKLYEIDSRLLYALSNVVAPLVDKQFERYGIKKDENPTRMIFKSIEELFEKDKSHERKL